MKSKRKKKQHRALAGPPAKSAKKPGKHNSEEVIPVNGDLLNVLAPISIELYRNRVGVGENMEKIYAIINYPSSPELGWLSKLTNIPNATVTLAMLPLDHGLYIDVLRRSIIQQKGRAQSSHDPLLTARAQRAAEDGQRTLVRMDQHGEKMCLLCLTVAAAGKDAEAFETACRMVESVCSIHNCKLRCLSHLQREGLQSILPFFTPHDEVKQIAGRPVPVGAVVGGFPWASSGWNDRKGWYLGKGANDSILMLDLWLRYGDRTNSNITVIGKSGMGKSTMVKHTLEGEYALGTKVIILDVESEYKDLCASLDGDWIDAGGGLEGRINPLQLRSVPPEDEESSGEDNAGELVWHIQSLETFFKLYLNSLSDVAMAALKECLIELYENFGITWDTDISTFANEDFPIMKDLYNLIKAKEKALVKAKDKDAQIYHDLAFLLKDAAQGAHAHLWNGHTTIKASKAIICLDTNNLLESSINIKRSQYYNILTWVWQLMTRNRQEKIILVADEAYSMVDPAVPESLIFLRNISKRARKYEAGIIFITQSIVDILSPEVKLHGQAILDNPTYKVIFGCDGQNLKEIMELYNLTEAEMEQLSAQISRKCLVIAGNKHMFVHCDYSDAFLSRMGTAGGRG